MHLVPSLALALIALSAASLAAPQSQGNPGSPPNLVLVMADDFGVDMVSAYGEGNSPCTPNLDRLASEGLLFRNAWTNPSCSPSRVSILTGRHAFRIGVGSPGGGAVLPLSELALPEVLTGYSSAWLGKWHVGGNNPNHPNQTGFDIYAGSRGGSVGGDYFAWNKTINGTMMPSTTYATVDTADDAIRAIRSLPEPWFVTVSFNAPHSPFHVPPVASCPTGCNTLACGTVTDASSNRQKGRAMAEAMDAQFGRVLSTLDSLAPDAYVVFIGDNGTARQVTQPPFISQRAKGSVYEGGVNVPLLVRGPGVAIGECAGLVSSTDLFATFGELSGTPMPADDTVSLVPYFTDPTGSLREFVFAETFTPNGFGPYDEHDRTVRERRFKLIRSLNVPDQLYDLALDPFEQQDLLTLPALSANQQAAYDRLQAELVRLGVD